MDFTYAPSGTTQQQAWFQEAVAACSYPLSAITAAVTVTWVAQLPNGSDTSHPYMVTICESAGVFTIYIASWADDPTNPNLSGLPSQGDVENFYKASVTHELGHVVADCTYDPQGAGTAVGVSTMCSLFWTPEIGNGGQRAGAPTDYASGTWMNEIREAVAEEFKLAFCATPTIFWNRTGWNIDQSNWAEFEVLIGGGTSAIVSYTETVSAWVNDPRLGGSPLIEGTVTTPYSGPAVPTQPGVVWPGGTTAASDIAPAYGLFAILDGAGAAVWEDRFGSDDSGSYSQFPPEAEIAGGVLIFDVPTHVDVNPLVPGLGEQNYTVILEALETANGSQITRNGVAGIDNNFTVTDPGTGGGRIVIFNPFGGVESCARPGGTPIWYQWQFQYNYGGGTPVVAPYPTNILVGSAAAGRALRGTLATTVPPAGRLPVGRPGLADVTPTGAQTVTTRGMNGNGSTRGALRS